MRSLSNDRVGVGLEATGHYSCYLESFIWKTGLCPVILNPLSTNMYRKAKTLRKIKIDKSDAKLIASMLLTDVKDSTPVRSHHVNELKSPSRHRFRPIGYRSKLKISIRRILDMTFRSSKVRCGPYINPAKPLVFAGPEPSMFQSGKYVAGNTPMVKHGSTYPRWALLNAARLVVMGDSTFSDYYWKKRDEGKHHNVALSHIERKLAR